MALEMRGDHLKRSEVWSYLVASGWENNTRQLFVPHTQEAAFRHVMHIVQPEVANAMDHEQKVELRKQLYGPNGTRKAIISLLLEIGAAEFSRDIIEGAEGSNWEMMARQVFLPFGPEELAGRLFGALEPQIREHMPPPQVEIFRRKLARKGGMSSIVNTYCKDMNAGHLAGEVEAKLRAWNWEAKAREAFPPLEGDAGADDENAEALEPKDDRNKISFAKLTAPEVAKAILSGLSSASVKKWTRETKAYYRNILYEDDYLRNLLANAVYRHDMPFEYMDEVEQILIDGGIEDRRVAVLEQLEGEL